jgi:HlyD family secretion protein
VQTIKATGTIQPINEVEVGSQVSGRIIKLYADFNSPVKKGDLIAQIDPAPYKARVAQDRASLQQNQAQVEEVSAKLKQAETELKRDQDLAKRNLVSQSDLDTSTANRDVLVAQLKLAKAALAQSRATLEISQTNLEYTSIRSPVDGVVIARNVNEGQAVVASLSVQTIFVIATDLQQIEVDASVPEADVGKIEVGQPVTFTVDAFPDETFSGTVSQVRIAATTVQNVVTYPVIISVNNSGGKLFPGMTANVSIEVARHKQVLKVANAALRFKPESVLKAQQQESSPENKIASSEKHTPPQPEVWIISGGELKAIPITAGINDGSYSEILKEELKEGQEVIIGTLESTSNDSGAVKNPFLPTMPKRPRIPH